jgi:hypothetical protein
MDTKPNRINPVAKTNANLSILITVSLLSYWIYTTLIQPISSFYKDYEAEITYFMNSLAVFKGKPYFYLDHPGTPVEILGSIILGFFYMFSGKNAEAFIQSQLQNPEPFFIAAHIVLTVLSIFCALLLYRTALSISSQERSNLFLAAALSIMFFAIHPLSFSTLTLWHHASFNFPFGTLYLIALLKLSQTNKDIPFSTIALLGLGAGFLTATMIYFGAWVIGTIVFVAIFYRIRKVHYAKTISVIYNLAGFSLLGFILTMLPAAKRIPYFINWIIGLVLHQGMYGGGASGIASLPTLWSNFLNIIYSLPAFSIFIFYVLILFIYATIKTKGQFEKSPGTWALAIALIVQIIILLALDIKHPGTDTFFVNRYLLPIAATMPILTLLTIQLTKISPKIYTISKYTTILFVFIGYFYFLSTSVVDHNKKSEIISKAVQESSRVIEKYSLETKRSVEQVNVLWTYETFSPCYSLWFGNELAGIVFSREAANICGQQNAFNIWNHGVIVGDNFVNIENMQWDLIFTRKLLLDDYPFLSQLGKTDEYLPLSPSDFDRFGSFIVIRKSD